MFQQCFLSIKFNFWYILHVCWRIVFFKITQPSSQKSNSTVLRTIITIRHFTTCMYSVPCSCLLQMNMCVPAGTYHLHPSPTQGKARSVRNNQQFRYNYITYNCLRFFSNLFPGYNIIPFKLCQVASQTTLNA